MAEKLEIKILSPRGLIYEKKADFISLPGEMGEIGLLPDHEPLLSTLKHGEIFIKDDSKVIKHYFIAEGFLKVAENNVEVIVEYADTKEDIDLSAELARKKEIEEKLKDEISLDERYKEEIALEKALLRIKVKKEE